MKLILLVSALGLLIGLINAAENPPQSPEALMRAYQRAIEAGDEAAVMALWEWDLENPEVVATRGQSVKRMIEYGKGAIYSLETWDATNSEPFVMDGYKVEILAPPEGGLKMGDATGGTLTPYAKVKSGYKLIGQRWTKLNWDGPADRPFSFSVSSRSPAVPDGPLKIKIRYNASGVVLEKTLFIEQGSQTISGGFSGQYVTQIEVVENKGPSRGFRVKSSDGSVVVFDAVIPAGTTGLIYNKGVVAPSVSTPAPANR